MPVYLAIAFGGAAGSVLRYVMGRMIQTGSPSGFPVGTLAVNVIGSLLIGVLARLYLGHETWRVAQAGLIVGFCGGFTTFSTFSMETVGLMAGGHALRAVTYALMSNILCLAATALGFFAMPAR